MSVFELINEDGTAMDDFPENSLKEKRDRLYPPLPMPQYSRVCDGYSCMQCDRCPKGDNWKVPEEDKAVWDEYQRQIKVYNRSYNPQFSTCIRAGIKRVSRFSCTSNFQRRIK